MYGLKFRNTTSKLYTTHEIKHEKADYVVRALITVEDRAATYSFCLMGKQATSSNLYIMIIVCKIKPATLL